jgi:eukaryotic-like serine/threonine-protein kinase
MTIAPGARLGPYEILSAIGAGGMGEVYRAHDTKLGRDVALKILPDSFARDPERVTRFKREAQVLAALNHPHIAAIYGLEDTNGLQFLVLELVDGETLADRLRRGPLPLDEALAIARQIADALEAAHEKNIIHRDLKPANIALTKHGQVKVLDFGLAKATAGANGASTDLANSPTLTSPAMMTGAGVILGTAAYMSPEQARGQAVDKRTDIWAFGCVLYEMLTGRPAFPGATVSDTIAAILSRDPEWKTLPRSTGEKIRDLLRRCLQKDPNRRLHDIADARIEVDEAQTGHMEGHVVPSGPQGTAQLVWFSALALVTVVVVATAVIVSARHPVPTAPEMRFEITAPPTTDPRSLAISPNGQKIAFVATTDGRSQLWLRSLDALVAQPLSGTDSAATPFWSPDSRSVGFFADGKLKRVDLDGGAVEAVATVRMGLGGAWNGDGTILFPQDLLTAIVRIPATGGEPVAVTRLEPPPRQLSHHYPLFLPDGRHFLYLVQGTPEARGVYIGQLDGTETRRLLDAESEGNLQVPAAYASSGHLLFIRQGTLFAQNFDPVRLSLSGSPFAVAKQVRAVSTSTAGPIVYRTGVAASPQRQFMWVDRLGREIGKVGDSDGAISLNPSLSPDGRRVAVQRRESGNTDVWLLETVRGIRSRFTFHPASDTFPIWSPDSRRIAFGSNRTGVYDLYQKPAVGDANEELLLTTPQQKVPLDWSSDGRFLLYRSFDPKTNNDLWALPLQGDRKPFSVVQTIFDDRDGQFSPDSKWIAYSSNESGRLEIYIQSFPGPGGKWQISAGGGTQVRWRRDGQELFYIGLDDRLMAVPIRFISDGQAVESSAPVPLFATHVGGAVQGLNRQQYMVSPDGQRFLMNIVTEEATTSPIAVILNWKAKP